MAGVVISYLESVEDELAVTVDNESRINKETAELEPRTGETVGQEEKIIVSDTADAPGSHYNQPISETQDIELAQPEEIQSEDVPTEISSGSNGTRNSHGGAGANGFCDRATRSRTKTEPQESPIKVEKPKVVKRTEPVVEQAREAEKPVVVSSSNVVSSSVSPEIPAEPVQIPQNLSQGGGRVIAEATGLAPPDDGLRVLSQTVTPPSADRLAMGARGRLEIEFSGDSWVEIRDALGRLVLADLMTPDKGVDLETYGPVEVLIGAVSVSDVTFNGERQDLEKRAFQDVARVTLGAATN